MDFRLLFSQWQLIRTLSKLCYTIHVDKFQMSPSSSVAHVGEYIACEERNELDRALSKNNGLNETSCDKEF